MPALDRTKAAELITRRHPEHTASRVALWRFLRVSRLGGSRYRDEVIGTDTAGYPMHFLVRHSREYPERDYWPNARGLSGSAYQADPADGFEQRRLRTPVPDFVPEVIRKHLSRIYAREVRREGNPPEYEAWAQNVDGKGTSVDRWVRHVVAPLLYALGTLDVLCDHPKAPDGEVIRTDADRRRLGLSRVVARTIAPEDVLWWRLNEDGSYAEVVNREWHDDPDDPANHRRVERFRHWTTTDWTLYDADGKTVASDTHPFGRVPQTRLRIGEDDGSESVGAVPLERAAEIQREYYNRDSELILSDTVQAHPTIQGAPQMASEPGGNDVIVGPSFILEMPKNPSTGDYIPFSVVEFPKGGAESIRLNLAKLRGELEQTYALNKPAGSSASGGNGSSVVAQSGVSKSYDAATLNDILGELADTLADAETHVGRLVMAVATDGGWVGITAGSSTSISIVYPKQFDLYSADELAERWLACLELAREGRKAPEATSWVVGSIVRDHLLPGRSDSDYEAVDREIRDVMAAADEASEAMAGLREVIGTESDDETDDPEESEDDDDANPDESDPE